MTEASYPAFDRLVRDRHPDHAFFLDPADGGAAWSECGVDPDAALRVVGDEADAWRTRRGWLPLAWNDLWEGVDGWLVEQFAAERTVAGYLGFELGMRGRGRPGSPVPDLYLCAYAATQRTVPDTGDGSRTALPALVAEHPPVRFKDAVRKARDRIAAGEIYQANLSHPFRLGGEHDPGLTFARLRARCPMPYGARLVFPGFEILSASPECLLRVRGDSVETRPIKGTRPRGRDPAEDLRLAAELLASEKDRAELVMIVDMERNDLGRVAEVGSVQVERLVALESFPNVHHLEACVRATLPPGTTAGRLLSAIFPGGSVTGCPKRRAIEWIRRLEGEDRGPYCGAIGVFRPDGSVDLSVAIRTAVWTAADRSVRLRSGAGLTWASDPDAEWEEVLAKASAFGEPAPP